MAFWDKWRKETKPQETEVQNAVEEEAAPEEAAAETAAEAVTPAAEAQAADRTHRIGQTKSVNCIKLLVKNSIEEKVLELQKMKAGLFNNLVEAPSEAMRGMSMEDFEFLLKD